MTIPAGLKALSRARYEALVAYTRAPFVEIFADELEWYATDSENVIANVLLDRTDEDYSSVLLGRDSVGRYRAIKLETSMPSVEAARDWAFRALLWESVNGTGSYPQGDEEEKEKVELFRPVVDSSRLHPYFHILANQETHISARRIIEEIMPHYKDIDGNFVEQFQTGGFDARVWEMYLFAYLAEEKFVIDRTHNAPDFIVEASSKIAIEAVIVGRKSGGVTTVTGKPRQLSGAEILKRLSDEMPIKFGSPLFTKLQKRYWELDHAKGLPLVLAIADFHDDQSMIWSSTALITYLYGIGIKMTLTPKGEVQLTEQKVSTHQFGAKSIPSFFFGQPNTEHISAVLFSASGTISKFNRMGIQAGYGSKAIIMIRSGSCHDHNPSSTKPKHFSYDVTTRTSETWAEGLNMYHNPNAKHPIDESDFPSIAHHRMKNEKLESSIPDFHPYASITAIIKQK